MDKYEYNVKLEQIKKLIRKKDYATAARIADTIDWYKVKNNQTIVLIADVYEASGRYEQARENLKLAYDRSGLGRQIAYKLVKVCIKCGKIDEAEDFYDDFVSAAPRDISKYLLQYELAKAKGEPLEKQISILEQYLEEDMDDRWAFELAKLYHKTGQRDKCIEQCDTVMLWFSDGKYVDKAMELKLQYAPLTKYQMDLVENREKYEEKLRAVEEEYKNGTYRKPEPEGEYLDTDEPEAELDDEPENEPEGQSEQAEPEEKAGKPKAETKPADEKVEKTALDEDVVASLHEAQAEEALAKEVSKIKPYDEEELFAVLETAVFQVKKRMEAEKQEAEDRLAGGTPKSCETGAAVPGTGVVKKESDPIQELDTDDIPEDSGAMSDKTMREIRDFVSQNYMHDISMQDAANYMRYSDTYFCRLFKQGFGCNFTTYLTRYRMKEAVRLLKNTELSVKEIALKTGYPDSNYFAKVFKRINGVIPSEFRG